MPRQVTIVAGPPCAGKTRYVTEHVQPGDQIICIDTLAQEAGSDRPHNHDGRFYGRAEREFRTLCRELGHHPTARAWIIRCAPFAHSRRLLALEVDATSTVVIVPPIDVAVERARERGSDYMGTAAAIQRWYRKYTHDPDDMIITEPSL